MLVGQAESNSVWNCMWDLQNQTNMKRQQVVLEDEDKVKTTNIGNFESFWIF